MFKVRLQSTVRTLQLHSGAGWGGIHNFCISFSHSPSGKCVSGFCNSGDGDIGFYFVCSPSGNSSSGGRIGSQGQSTFLFLELALEFMILAIQKNLIWYRTSTACIIVLLGFIWRSPVEIVYLISVRGFSTYRGSFFTIIKSLSISGTTGKRYGTWVRILFSVNLDSHRGLSGCELFFNFFTAWAA